MKARDKQKFDKVKSSCLPGFTVAVDDRKGIVQYVDNFQQQLLVCFEDCPIEGGPYIGIVDFEDIQSFAKCVQSFRGNV